MENEARELLRWVKSEHQFTKNVELSTALVIGIDNYLSKPEPAPLSVTPSTSERDRLAEIAWRKFVVYYKGQLTESHFASIADASYAAADAFLKAGEKSE